MYYIEQSILESFFKVPFQTLRTSTKRNRQGKTQSWSNKKDLKDKRKVLIDIDSIPEPTRKKYNIPTGKEYFEQQELERYTAEQEKIKRDKELRTNAEKSALYNAYNNDYFPFVELYREFYGSNNNIPAHLPILSAKEHAFWLKMIEVTGTKYATFSGGCKRGFKLFMDLKNELVFTKQFTNENYFRILISQLRSTLLEEKSIIPIVANCRFNATKNLKTNDFHKGIVMAFLSHPNKYSYRVVTDLVNYHCLEENQTEITESWIKKLMVTDNHFRTIVMASRNGEKYTNENILAHAVRKETLFPANVWMLDGSPLQFYCWNESRTKLIRLNLFVIIDVCSRKIVGFDVSYSEDRFNIMNALKMAVMFEGHLPAEIVSDNFSASKTEEIKALKEQMAKLGTNWRHAKVGNPQDKSYVERFFGSFQSVECSLYDDYIGEGIMSKRDNRRTAEQLLATSKKDGFPTFNQMKDRVITMVLTYNQREKANRKAPKVVYNSLPKPNAKELDSVRTALLFWKRTKATVRKSMVKIVVDKTEHFYEIKKHKTSTELQGKQVYVRYDEIDLDRIMLFDIDNDIVICECKKALKIATCEVDRTQEDIDNMYKITAKKKSKIKYLADEKARIEQGILEVTKKEVFEGKHPMGLSKNQLTEADDQAQRDLLRSMLAVTKEDEKEFEDLPLIIIKNPNVKNYQDLVSQKKPSQKGSLKVVSP